MRLFVNVLLSGYRYILFWAIAIQTLLHIKSIYTYITRPESIKKYDVNMTRLLSFWNRLAPLAKKFRSKELWESIENESSVHQEIHLWIPTSRLAKIHHVVSLYKDIIIWSALVSWARFIISVWFVIINKAQDWIVTTNDKVAYENMDYSEINSLIWMSTQTLLDHLALFTLSMVIIAGFCYTLSFWSKIWKGFAQLMLIWVFLLLLFWLFLQLRGYHLNWMI